MSSPLARVKRAATAKRRADEQYRAALVAAVQEFEEAGSKEPLSGRPDAFARVARAAGISRQAVRQLVERHRATT